VNAKVVVDLELLERLAYLARIEVPREEAPNLLKDLQRILEFIDKINQLDLENVEPLIHLSFNINVLRKDEPEKPLPKEEILQNAPRADSDYFRVPKVLEK